MKYLVTGAGQIGSQLIADLLSEGHDINVVRANNNPIPGTALYRGDVRNPDLIAAAARGCAAVFHCTHAPYDSRVWEEVLPATERVVLDQAARNGIPVVFPESVYAFAAHEEIRPGEEYAPIDGKGEVRVTLLEQRKQHEARAISVIAADLYGPTATVAGSVLKATVLEPMAKGRPVVVMANPDARHSFTYIPDLTRAMRMALEDVDNQKLVHAPTAPTMRLRDWAPDRHIWSVPQTVLKVAGKMNRTMYELSEISPIWYRDSVLVSS